MKRRSEKEITKDNFQENGSDGEAEGSGGFQFASEEEIKGRKIVKARKRKGEKSKVDSTAAQNFDGNETNSFSLFSQPTTSFATLSEVDRISKLEERVRNLEDEIEKIKKNIGGTDTAKTEASNEFSSQFDFSFPSTWDKGESVEKTDNNVLSSSSSSDFSFLSATPSESPMWKDTNDYKAPELPEEKSSQSVAKVELPTEPISTGEEEEQTLATFRTKILQLVKSSGEESEDKEGESEESKTEAKKAEWKECGVGNLKFNSSGDKARLIMRTDTTFRLVLNAAIFPEMIAKKMTEKQVLISVIDPESITPKSFLIRFQKPEHAKEILDLIEKYKQKSKNPTTTEVKTTEEKTTDNQEKKASEEATEKSQ